LSNPASLPRLNLFTYRAWNAWLDNPFGTPPILTHLSNLPSGGRDGDRLPPAKTKPQPESPDLPLSRPCFQYDRHRGVVSWTAVPRISVIAAGATGMMGAMHNGISWLIAGKQTLGALTNVLENELGSKVLDKTGLTGTYDLTLDYVRDQDRAISQFKGLAPGTAPAADDSAKRRDYRLRTRNNSA
jgi:uncharacterized protein (TIGR03435 family)